MCWIYVIICFAVVCIVGLMSGLTLGLMSLSAVDLEVLAKSGQPNHRVNPENILPLVRNKHLLLSTFAIYNSLAAEALSIFIDALIPTWASILISAILLLAFGEISYHAGSRAGGGSRGGGHLGGCSTPRPEVEHVLEHHEAEEDVVEEEVESSQGKMELDPNGLWFNDTAVSRTITDAFKKYFHHPWRNYSMVDQETKDHWFKLFKDTYKWRSELDHEVRKGFDKKAEIRLEGLYQYLTKKKMGVCPLWMPNLVHKAMMKNVKDDTFKLKSQKSIKNNKRGGDLDNLIQPSHCQGSNSAAERAKRLASKSGRVLPTVAKLHLDTYIREETKKGKVPVSERVKRIKEKYEKNVADYKERGFKKTLNQISYDTVNGRKRGNVAGLGASADLNFERSLRRVGKSSCCDPFVIDKLSARLEESERARADDARKNVENAKKNAEDIVEMKKNLDMYAQMFSQCNGFDFSQKISPHPDDESGSGRACAT